MPTCRPRAKSRSVASRRRATANLSANLNARVDLQWLQPNYTFATPVIGGQLTLSMARFVGRQNADVAGTLTVTHSRRHSVASALRQYQQLRHRF